MDLFLRATPLFAILLLAVPAQPPEAAEIARVDRRVAQVEQTTAYLALAKAEMKRLEETAQAVAVAIDKLSALPHEAVSSNTMHWRKVATSSTKALLREFQRAHQGWEMSQRAVLEGRGPRLSRKALSWLGSKGYHLTGSENSYQMWHWGWEARTDAAKRVIPQIISLLGDESQTKQRQEALRELAANPKAIEAAEACFTASLSGLQSLRQSLELELPYLNPGFIGALRTPLMRVTSKPTQAETRTRVLHAATATSKSSRERIAALSQTILRLQYEWSRARVHWGLPPEPRVQLFAELAKKNESLRTLLGRLDPELAQSLKLAEQLLNEGRFDAAEQLIEAPLRNGQEGERKIAEALYTRLRDMRAAHEASHRHGHQHEAIVKAMGYIKGATAKKASAEERIAALAKLEAAEGGWPVSLMRGLLAHENVEVRRAAIKAVAAEGSLDAVELLINRLHEPHKDLLALIRNHLEALRERHQRRLEALQWLKEAREREARLKRGR